MDPFDDIEAAGADPPDPAYAVELLDSLVAMVIAKVNGDMNYRGDPARYTRVRRELDGQLRGLRMRRMSPWHTLDEGVAALKLHASGSGSHQARRDRAAELTEPLRAQLQQLLAGAAVTDPGPVTTSWPGLEQRLTGLHNELRAADSLDGLQDVGRRAREILIDLAALVWRPDMLPPGEPEPKAGDAKTRLYHAAAALMSGHSHADWRKLIKASWDLASTITHSNSINRVDAFAAVQATVLLVRTFEVASDQASRT